MAQSYPRTLRPVWTSLFFFLLLQTAVAQQVTVTSVSPTSGPVGTTVTIAGTNFSTTPTYNIVRFGNARVRVSSATSTTLTVQVPGFTNYGPITVTTGGYTASLQTPFAVTFPGAGSSLAAVDSFELHSLPNGPTEVSFVVDDVNGTGMADVLIFGSPTNDFTAFPNFSVAPPGLHFDPGGPVTTLSNVTGPAVTFDMNNDGLRDLYISNYLFQNDGGGETIHFTQQTSPLYTNSLTPVSESYADLDGDGFSDLIVAYSDTTLAVFRNTSNPLNNSISFAAPKIYKVGRNYKSLATGDVNGDGKPDIILTTRDSSRVSIYTNNSTMGNISLIRAMDYYFYGLGPDKIATGDLDGDGKLDLAITDVNRGKLMLFRNTGSSGSVAFTSDTSIYGGNQYLSGIAIGDLDGDGKQDIVVAGDSGQNNVNHGYPTVGFKNVSTSGSITLQPGVNYNMGYSSRALALADMNGDGMPDIVTLDPAGSQFLVSLNHFKTDTTSDSTSLVPASISNFSPDSAIAGTTITIKGEHFLHATAVTFGGTAAASYNVVSDSLILATVGSGSSGVLQVTAPGGWGTAPGFVYIASTLPTHITRFTPTSARTGDTVHIYGNSFTGTSYVTFGYTGAKRFDIINDTMINAVVGNGASGLIRINSPSGLDSIAGFTYIDTTASSPDTTSTDTTTNTPPPVPVTISHFSPSSAHTGDTVQIYGHSFTGTNVVSFGNINAQRYTVINDSLIDAVVGTGASGLIRISGSSGLDSIAGFTYIDTTSSPDTTSHDTTAPAFRITQFTGSVIANQAVLLWSTRHEKGLSYYVIEHGADTSHLTAIGAVPALNEDSATYSFSDTASRSGINYYRLQAGEATGDTVSSGIIAVQLAGAPATLTGYPNPAVSSLLVALPSILKQSKFMLVDMNGNTLQTIVVGANIPQTQIDVSHLNPGIYKLVWSDGTNVSYQLVMIMK